MGAAMTDDDGLPVGDNGLRPAEPTGYIVGASDNIPGFDSDGTPTPPQPRRVDTPLTPASAGALPWRWTWMNWASLLLGLVGIVTCLGAIPAIVLGHLGVAAARRGGARAKAAGVIGLILGYGVIAAYLAAFTYSAVTGNSVQVNF